MPDKPKSGSFLGIPYNFERPSLGRLLGAYWRPGEGLLVEKPFGIGYTLNLANWRSWLVVTLVGILLWGERHADEPAEAKSEPVEVVVED